jgi:YbgC/YbaW family acyl-CoA thioester hydrolase
MKVLRTEKRIWWGDLDPLGIVFYPRYYEWMDAHSHLFFHELGLPLGDLLRRRGIIFGLVETSCRYLAPGHYLDRVRLETTLTQLRSKTLVLHHRMVRIPEEVTLVEGNEHRICLKVRDDASLQAVEIPGDLHRILSDAAV